MIVPDYSIWVIIFFFYFVEHIKRVEHNSVLILLSGNGDVDMRANIVSFELLRATFTILPIFNYNKTVFFGQYLVDDKRKRPSGGRELMFLRLLRRRTILLSRMEPIAFFFYFILSPTLSVEWGLGYSLQIVLPIHAAFLGFSIYQLLAMRHLLKLRGYSCFRLIVEAVVSPGLIPALSKKITASYRMKNDAPKLLLSRMPEARRSDELHSIRSKLEDRLAFEEIDQHELDSYMLALEGVA